MKALMDSVIQGCSINATDAVVVLWQKVLTIRHQHFRELCMRLRAINSR